MHYTTSNTQSSAPEDGRNHRPKHVELIGIVNKPLLLHVVGCLYYVYVTIHVKNPLLLSILIKLEFYRQVLQKYSNINFEDNPPVGAELFHAERGTDGRTDGETDMKNLTVTNNE